MAASPSIRVATETATRLIASVLLFAVASVAWIGSAQADRRVALVIGNGSYRAVGGLRNPVNDANLVAAALKTDGFAVTTADDLSHVEFLSALRAFRSLADNADWAMVYYAGHGIELSGVNYLVPVDATLAQDRDVADESIALDRIMAAVDGVRGIRIVVLDACRNNPFLETMQRTTGAGRDIGRGLTRVEPAQATLVVYSAKDGSIAQDGEGENSPFATALAQHLTDPVTVEKMFSLVRDDVLAATANRQQPFVYGSLPGHQDFYLRPTPPGALQSSQPISESTEITFWNSIASSKDKLDLEAYLAKFPNGNFAALARNRLAALGLASVPAAVDGPVSIRMWWAGGLLGAFFGTAAVSFALGACTVGSRSQVQLLHEADSILSVSPRTRRVTTTSFLLRTSWIPTSNLMTSRAVTGLPSPE